MKKILLISVMALIFIGASQPKAEAMEPTIMLLLLPYAMPVAEKAAGYAFNYMVNSIPGFIAVGKDIFSIFLLPVGVLETTLGLPFGLFGQGVDHVVTGVEAPFLLVIDTLFLPVRGLGLNSPNG